MCGSAARVQYKVPMKCTAIMASMSASDISCSGPVRRMPALLIRMSTRPQALSAALMIRWADAGSATLSLLATASPPAARISSTTAMAADDDPPSRPLIAPPVSLTTTLAPRDPSSKAYSRPRPVPAPVTMATRSS